MKNPHRFCIAPMMRCTDTHFRNLARMMTKESMLYTEMITSGALLHGDYNKFLSVDVHESPIALQVGGSDPEELKKCALLAKEFSFNEVNLNVGCPSERVQAGRFGACLMLEPELVAECVDKMQIDSGMQITVKSRIGVDEQDSYDFLHRFIEIVSATGCSTFIIHARKAFLSGLSPKENRTIPSLKYEYVYKIKRDFPDLKIVINGGVTSIAQVHQHLEHVDGVMVGREAYDNPYFLNEIDNLIFNTDTAFKTRHEILNEYKTYMQRQLERGVSISSLIKPIFGLFNGVAGARGWRRKVSEDSRNKNADVKIFDAAQEYLSASI